jgi:NAD(P)-dependent dehydrogenase (short-subunit alcohol dehydrogenase family)
VNVNGPLVLFQATYPLLRASTPAPKFVAVSSVAGSIVAGAPSPFRGTAYGASKAALNFVVRKLRAEHAGLGACERVFACAGRGKLTTHGTVAFAVCPGGVATDMGTSGAAGRGRRRCAHAAQRTGPCGTTRPGCSRRCRHMSRRSTWPPRSCWAWSTRRRGRRTC